MCTRPCCLRRWLVRAVKLLYKRRGKRKGECGQREGPPTRLWYFPSVGGPRRRRPCCRVSVVLFSACKCLCPLLLIFLLNYSRRRAGGFPPSMAVQKNKYLEEWNGKREITEKTFSIEFGDVPTFIMTLIVIPYGIYTWTRSEFKNRGDRRYADVV